jgi:hypothetical protein
MPTKKEQWAALLELNDIQIDNALTANDEESSHADGDDYDEGGGGLRARTAIVMEKVPLKRPWGSTASWGTTRVPKPKIQSYVL